MGNWLIVTGRKFIQPVGDGPAGKKEISKRVVGMMSGAHEVEDVSEGSDLIEPRHGPGGFVAGVCRDDSIGPLSGPPRYTVREMN